MDNWPYPTIDRMWYNGDHSWFETSAEVYDDQLGCVPPARMENGVFMVGECWSNDTHGGIYATFCEIGGRFFCRNEYLSCWQPAIFRKEIKAQFGL